VDRVFTGSERSYDWRQLASIMMGVDLLFERRRGGRGASETKG